jgi:hypothetical protein
MDVVAIEGGYRITGDDIANYWGYLTEMATGGYNQDQQKNMYGSLLNGLEDASGKNSGSGGPMESTLSGTEVVGRGTPGFNKNSSRNYSLYTPEETNEACIFMVGIAGGEIAGVFLGVGMEAYSLYRAARLAENAYVNLASAERTAHIIAGDATGGGHAWFGSLKSFANGLLGKKSMFPASWSNSKIMNAISDVAVNNSWIQQTGKAGAAFTKSGQPVKYVIDGVYEGVKIRVVATPTEIITAFPIK